MDFQTRYRFSPKADLIGKGGFSKVYKAYDTLLERTVALKFFNASAHDKYQVLSEIKRVIQFEHPNLCKYYDVAVLTSRNVLGEVEQAEVGIMEYLDAGNFKTFTGLYPAYIDKLLVDVLEGLGYLHRKGVVHRDLKPQNILIKMVEDEPVAKITDFGISKLIDNGDNNSSNLIGTIEYMAPEQFNPKKYGIGGRISTNLDLWSFGHLVYETIQKEPLFGSRSSGVSAEQVMTNILGDTTLAKIDALPEKYQQVVRRCLVKDASVRAQHAHELIPLLTGADPVMVYIKNRPDTRPIQDFDTREIRIVLQQDAGSQETTEQIPASSIDDYKTHRANAEDVTVQINRKRPDTADDATQVVLPRPAEEVKLPYVEKPAVRASETPGEQPATMAFISPPATKEQQNPASGLVQGLRLRILRGASQGNYFFQNKLRPLAAAAGTLLIRHHRAAIVLCALLLFAVALLFFLRQKPEHAIAALPQSTKQPLQAVAVTKSFQPEVVVVSGAVFEMGKGVGSQDGYLVHAIQLDSFAIGKTEVTVAAFRQFVAETQYRTTAEVNGSSQVYDTITGKWKSISGVNWRHDMYGYPVSEQFLTGPVVHVSWHDAMAYCKWRSEKEQKVFRLPTEAEWEFAAKGGSRSKGFQFSGSNQIDEVAWYGRNASLRIYPVNSKKANELGIYDMSGNVMEWCLDWFDPDYYQNSVLSNPKGPAAGKVKVVRGGSWFLEDPKWLQPIYRAGLAPGQTGGQLGFRVCLEIGKTIQQ